MGGLQKIKKRVAFFLLLSMLAVLAGVPAIAKNKDTAIGFTVYTDHTTLNIGKGDVLSINSWLSSTTSSAIVPVTISGAYADKVKLSGLAVNKTEVADGNGGKSDTYSITYPPNGRQVTFLTGLNSEMPTGLKNGQELARISIGGDADQSAVITLYYSTLKTADKIMTNFSEVRLTDQQTQSVSAWLSPKPVEEKQYAITVSGNYADYITVEPAGTITFGPDGVPAQLKIGLVKDKPLPETLTDGYILGEVIIGSDGCQPAAIYVRYAKEERYLNEIVFLERKLELEVDKTYQMEPVLRPQNATDTELIWEVKDSKPDVDGEVVAEVNHGLVTALAPGTATLTATAARPTAPNPDGSVPIRPSASIQLTVYRGAGSQGYDVQVVQLGANPGDVVDPDDPDALRWHWNDDSHQMLLVTGQQNLELTLVTKDNKEVPSEPIRWKSNRCNAACFLNEENQEVSSVTVQHKGAVLSVKGPGDVTITATGLNSGQRYSFTLKAQVQKIEEIQLSYRDYYDGAAGWTPLPLKDGAGENVPLTLADGRKLQLKADLIPADTTDRKITWKTTNSKVAKVDRNNVLIAAGPGEATITAQVKQTVEKKAGEGKKEEIVVMASFPVLVGEGNAASSIRVTPCDEEGNIAPGTDAVVVKIEGTDDFENRTDEDHPVVLGAGNTTWFLVHQDGDDLNESPKIKWKASRNGYLTLKQKTLKNGNTLLSVRGTTSVKKLKEYDKVRLVATNAGDFPIGNYPEVFFQIEAATPENIEIKNVPKFLEIGRTRELGISVKPKRSDERVLWSVNDDTIAEIDETTGVIKGLATGTVTVTAVSVKAAEAGKTVKAEVEIPVGYKVSSAKLNATSIKLFGDETFQLLLSILPYQAQHDYEAADMITYVAQDDHIAYVDDDGLIHLYDTAQPGEKTTIHVYIGDPENPVKKLKCKVQVAKEETDDPSDEELAKVVVTTKTPVITSLPGNNKKLTYAISGLNSAQKSRVRIDWTLVDETNIPGVTGDEVLVVDQLGVVSVLENPQASQGQVKAAFYYIKHDGTPVPLPTTEEAAGNTALLYTININPALVVSIDGQEAVRKPDIIYIDSGFPADGVTLEAILTPPDGAAIHWAPNKSFEQYLAMTPAADNPDFQTITLKGERPDNVVTVSLKLSSEAVKKSVTVKFKIYPAE